MAARKKAKASKKSVRRARKAPARKAKKTKARKAAARKPARKAKPAEKARAKTVARKKAAPRKRKQIVGEGDYEASRAFLKDQAGFVKENKARIPEMGKQAREALDGSEGPALMAAEAEAKGHSRGDTNENT